MLIEIYLKFKGLIGQGNNTKKDVFDKIADEFNKHADIKGTGEQCLRKWKNWKQNKKKSSSFYQVGFQVQKFLGFLRTVSKSPKVIT